MGILSNELNRIHHEMAKIADKYFGEGEKTADTVPVVRCKDCKWYYQLWIDAGVMVEHCHRVHGVVVNADGFCAWGKRREDDEPVKPGRWIRNDNGTYSCSQCHSWIPDEQHYYARYCLFCGAKMDEVSE